MKPHTLRAIIIAIMVTLFIHGLKTVPIADFYCIIFLSPFLVTIISYFAFNEPLKLERIAVLCLAFTGVIITIGPHFSDMTIGYAFILAAVLFGSTNILVIRKMGQNEYSPLYGFYPLLAIVMINLPFAVQDIPTTMPLSDMGIFLLYGIVLIGAHTFLPMAFARTPEISMIAPLHYSQMIWGVLADIIIFHANPPLTTFIGGSLIVTAGMIMLWNEKHHIRKPKH
jgi:S-adenosylmethionine uptake transporter